MRVLVLLLVTSFSAAIPGETIYRYLDSGGGVTYTNIPHSLPSKGVEKINVPIPPPLPNQNEPKLPGAPMVKAKPAQPANFPKVDSQTQKKRDQSRRQILDDELKAEMKSLDEAKTALRESEAVKLSLADKNHQKYIERLQELKEKATLHENNIEALKKEIATLK